MADIDDVRMRVSGMISAVIGDFETVTPDHYAFDHGSARIEVHISDMGSEDSPAIVEISSTLACDMPTTAELLVEVATSAHNHMFGTFTLEAQGEGLWRLVFFYRMIAESLDLTSFAVALAGVAGTADGLDELMVERFGGRLWRDR